MAGSYKRELMAAALGSCLIATPAAADMVVVQAHGPGLTVGQVVATGAAIALPAASRALLLTRDGHTVALAGPFSGPVSDPGGAGGDARTVTVLSRLLTSGNADNSALGVTRGADFGSPDAITIADGNYCQAAGEPPRFGREMGSPEQHLTVTAPSGASETLVWPEGEGELAWPAKLPVAEGAYRLRLDSQPKPVSLPIRLVPAGTTGPVALAVWMAEHGCQDQARRLLAGLR